MMNMKLARVIAYVYEFNHAAIFIGNYNHKVNVINSHLSFDGDSQLLLLHML